MSTLTFKPAADAGHAGDKLIAVPTLTDSAALIATSAKGAGARSIRHRFNVTRLAIQSDDGFRPFRIY